MTHDGIDVNPGGEGAVLNLDETREWLAIVYSSTPGLINICGTREWAGRTFAADDIDGAVAYIQDLDARQQPSDDGKNLVPREGIYLRATTLKAAPEQGQRGGDDLSFYLPGLWGDIDIAGPGHKTKNILPPDVTEAMRVVQASGLPEPSHWIHSGGGLYPWWLLESPIEITDLEDFRALSQGWQNALARGAEKLGYHYGSGIGDLSRVLRIPGTVNRKAGLERPCTMLEGHAWSGPLYDEAALFDALAAVTPEPPKPTPIQVKMAQSGRDGEKPGDEFNRTASWHDILLPHGWQWIRKQGDNWLLRRPGKMSGGHSATLRDSTDRLWVFSEEAHPLQAFKLYDKFGAYCVVPETKILTADLRWVQAGSLAIGDELVGIDEEIERFNGRRKLRVSEVTGMEFRRLPCYRITLEDGRTLTSTDGHPWLACSAGSGGNMRWIRTEDLRKGQKICSLTRGTWETATDFDSGWLSGMYDGEGCFSGGKVTLAQKTGQVFDRAEALLKEKGFEPKRIIRTNGVGNLVVSDLPSIFRLLGMLQPGRLVAKKSWVGRGAWVTTSPKAVVESVEFVGEKRVAAFSTSTRTFIAEGLVSHNTALEHGGDFAAAGKFLASKGYGSSRPPVVAATPVATPIDIGDLVSMSMPPTAGADPSPGTAGPIPATPVERPMIIANEDRLLVWKGITKCLQDRWNGERLFDFGGVICERRETTMRPLNRAALDSLTTETCNIVNRKFNQRTQVESFPSTAPEARMLDMILSRPEEFVKLEKLSQVPFVRPDGTICATEGYDAATHTFLELDPALRGIDVPETPSKEQVLWAKDLLLNELLGDFPLHTDSDKANALATLLTPFVRDLVPVSPLAVIDAKEAGSGKNLLADIISVLFTGRSIQTLPYSTDDAEQRKVITSAFRDGHSVLLFDEAHQIEGANFARALTSHSYQDRILGSSVIAEFPNNRTWISLGNQVQIKGDMARRVYRVRLEYEGSRPESRPASSFRHPDLRQWAHDNRAQLVRACLILVRAWYALNRPTAPLPFRMGSFEKWQEILAGILWVAGVPDFLANVPQWRSESDFDRQHTVGHLQWLAQQYAGAPFTAAQATEALKRDRTAEHPPAMDDPFQEGYARRIGQWYARAKDRVLDGLKLIKLEGQAHTGVAKWMVIKVEDRE